MRTLSSIVVIIRSYVRRPCQISTIELGVFFFNGVLHMETRIFRDSPFCWQEKEALRFLRKNFSGRQLVNLRCLYLALTEIESDFAGKEIKHYTKMLESYSGMSRQAVSENLSTLESIGFVKTEEKRDEHGRFNGRTVILQPVNNLFSDKNILKNEISFNKNNNGTGRQFAVTGKTARGFAVNGYPRHKKISIKEDKKISIKEDNKKRRDLFLSEFSELLQLDKQFIAAWQEFYSHRKEIKKPLSRIAVKRIAKQFQDYTPEECTTSLKESVQRCWIGVFPKKLKQEEKKENESKFDVLKEWHNEIYAFAESIENSEYDNQQSIYGVLPESA